MKKGLDMVKTWVYKFGNVCFILFKDDMLRGADGSLYVKQACGRRQFVGHPSVFS